MAFMRSPFICAMIIARSLLALWQVRSDTLAVKWHTLRVDLIEGNDHRSRSLLFNTQQVYRKGLKWSNNIIFLYKCSIPSHMNRMTQLSDRHRSSLFISCSILNFKCWCRSTWYQFHTDIKYIICISFGLRSN